MFCGLLLLLFILGFVLLCVLRMPAVDCQSRPGPQILTQVLSGPHCVSIEIETAETSHLCRMSSLLTRKTGSSDSCLWCVLKMISASYTC